MASTNSNVGLGAFGLILAMVAGTTMAVANDQPANPADQSPEATATQQFAPETPAGNTITDATTTAPTGDMISDEATTTEGKSGVAVDDFMTVDLHVKDEDLANVLEMLSIQSQKNIIASRDVQARVTANLYGVTFYEALDAILNVNGYGFIEEGNFIKIYTLEELQKIQAAQRQKVSKVLSLNYMNAVDASEFVKPLLSPEGQVKVNSKASGFQSLGETPAGGEDYVHGSVLVVFDFEENVAQIEELVRQIDTRPAQVLVEATVLQTQLNEANALGVDFSIVANTNFNQFTGSPLGVVNRLIGGADTASRDRGATGVTSTVGNTAGEGGFKVGIVSNDVSVFLRALDEVTDTTVLSNPKILTLNRMSARVLVGRKVGYISTTSNETSTTQSVEFLDTGTQLSVRPFVTNDGMIRMELRPQVSEAAIRDVQTASGGSTVTIPDEITQELNTNILVRDGQTVVLGGLFRENVTATRRQVPFLGDIPLIGRAFRGNDDNTDRNEIIFLVTPTIVSDATLSEAGERGKQYVDKALFGARQGVLPWSRERMTNALNIEADRLSREGRTAEALSKIDRSLSLSSRQPELIDMRERLTGEKSKQVNRSFLEKILKPEAAENLLQVKAQEELLSSTQPQEVPADFAQTQTQTQAQAQAQFIEPETATLPGDDWAANGLTQWETATPAAPPALNPNFNFPGAYPAGVFAEDFSFLTPEERQLWIGPSPFTGNLQQLLERIASQPVNVQAVTAVETEVGGN